jgi:hypothetical protein
MTSPQIHVTFQGHDVHGAQAVAVGAVEVAFAPVAAVALVAMGLVRGVARRRLAH